MTLTQAIVRAPAPNFSEGLTTAGLGEPDYGLAIQQHEAYCAALERCGLTLTRLEADPNYPDSTFVEDTAVLITHRQGTRGAEPYHHVAGTSHPLTQVVLTRPGAPSRRGEIERVRCALSDYFPSLSAIQPPGTLDGGDVCEAGDHFFIGISERTNEAGAQQLAEQLVPLGYASTFIGIHDISGLLHLKSGLAYLGNNCLAVTEALADRREFSAYNVVRVNSDEAYAANCVRINNHVLLAAGYPALALTLREAGYETIALEMAEFQKMDGGLSCLSLRF